MKNKTVPIECLRKAGLAVLPPEGGWVSIRGNPIRGRRIIPSIAEAGVQHLDIYWAYQEESLVNLNVTKYKEKSLLRDWENDPDLLIEYIGVQDFWGLYDPMLQLTWMTIVNGSSQHIRFYNGEVSLFSEDLISDLLKEDLLTVINFSTDITSPVLDDVTKDIIGSLQLDGLSKQQAIHEVITEGLLDPDTDTESLTKAELPTYFYRPIGVYRAQFVEEEDAYDYL